MTQISVSNAGIEFGASRIFQGITFTVARGSRWGIIGRNGSGKTTLFRMITGAQQPTEGTVSRPPGIRFALLEQHRDFGGAQTVWEAGAGELAELLALEQALAKQAELLAQVGESATPQMLAKYDHDLERFDREGGYTLAPRVDAILQGLGFDPESARTQPLEQLSGGERGRLGLARQLVSAADVLLLDEPTNHLDLETTRWLEDYLRNTDKTVLLISHDRTFIANVADHILHLEGESAVAYTGGYESFVVQREERRLAQQRAFEKQRKVIASEEDYIRRNIAGQNSKQAKGRRKRLTRVPRLSGPTSEDGSSLGLRLDLSERGGDQVVVARDLTLGVEGRTLIERFTATIQRGDIVGFIGPNGSGKSTLLRALMGEHPVTSGELKLGGSIQPGYYRQDMTQVPRGRTLYEIISELRPRWERRQVHGHLAKFGFSGEEAQRRADNLSGGEQARVALAMMVLTQANFLLLDEPTNHLDIESVEALEDALSEYEGTILLVSHDRAMLEALTSRVWVLHERHITDFPGSFSEWEERSREREHAAAVAAAEQESSRRVKERQATRRREGQVDENRAALRESRRQIEASEKEIAALEEQIARLTQALADPELYTTREGTQKSVATGKKLEETKRKLDAAFAKWTAATERAEQLSVS
ncbi:MAG TPA: ABC-F family ATP-binding cassette domain-containing protein [Gemmatimonadaceae bacterium]|nr:ABC-F family ATP-binding cassette domain-containing protein [Gemmatimonadaceae bacterium]